MKNTIYSILAVVGLVACGASENDFDERFEYVRDAHGSLIEIIDRWAVEGEGTEDGELAQLGQAYHGSAGPNLQHGVTANASRLACSDIVSDQTCSIPQTRNPTWAFDQNNGFTADERSKFRTMLTAIDSTVQNFTFTEVHFDLNPTILVNRFACGSGSSSNNIDAFSCAGLTFAKTLSEAAGVVGNYQVHSRGVLHIDVADCNAKGSTTAQDDFCKMHAYGNAINVWMGNGRRTDSAANGFTTRRSVVLTGLNLPMTAGEDCRLESYNATDNGSYTINGTCASD